MRTKMNILSIISIFLILTTVTGIVGAASPAETKQDSRLKALESSVTKILTRLGTVESNVANILTRLAAVESNVTKVHTPPYNAVYGKFQESFSSFQGDSAMNITIDVPVTSNVYLSASGLANSAIEPYLRVDNGMVPDWAYVVQAGGFTISRVVQLNKGIHKIDLRMTGNPPDIYGVTMSAVVSENGSLDCGIYDQNCTPQ